MMRTRAHRDRMLKRVRRISWPLYWQVPREALTDQNELQRQMRDLLNRFDLPAGYDHVDAEVLRDYRLWPGAERYDTVIRFTPARRDTKPQIVARFLSDPAERTLR